MYIRKYPPIFFSMYVSVYACVFYGGCLVGGAMKKTKKERPQPTPTNPPTTPK